MIIKPIPFYAHIALHNKTPKPYNDINVYLLKYFPKFYQWLPIYHLTGPIELKIKRLKIVRSCMSDPAFEKHLKKFLQTNRKTLKYIPRVADGGYECYPDFSLCMFLPKVETLILKEVGYLLSSNSAPNLEYKQLSHAFGYFWDSSRFVKRLEIGCETSHELVLIKKMNKTKRFLSSLNKLELNIQAFSGSMRFFMELIENKNFLRHITHLSIGTPSEKTVDWEAVQFLINCCRQLNMLSFETDCIYERFMPDNLNPHQGFISQGFYLDLSCLQNLQILKLERVEYFKTFVNNINFPPSLREITLHAVDKEEPDNLRDVLDCEDSESERMIVKQDIRDWKSFEKQKMLSNFFEKWKKLRNLRVLNLTFKICKKIDLLRTFVLPLLRAIPQLETFNYEFGWDYSSQRKIAQFDFGVFLSGIKSLQSLKNLRIHSGDPNIFCVSPFSENEVLLCNFSSF